MQFSMPDLGIGPWMLISLIALAASFGTLHIICKRLATDWEIAGMVREARALRQDQEKRLAEMRSGNGAQLGAAGLPPLVDEEPIFEVGAPGEMATELDQPPSMAA
jgi:hypothetical protein